MSPEQAAGDTAHIGASSDVYSLGATLYAILTGNKAVGGSSLNELLQNARSGKFPRPRSVRVDIPQPLEAVCLKAMSLNPSDRYATPLDLATDIEHWLADEPVSALREPWSKRASRWMKRHRTFVAALGAAALVALIALGTTSAILGHKNRELIEANRTAEENLEETRATLRGIIEFALHGRTLSDNIALDPVRLEILQRGIGYAERLQSRQPENGESTLDHALLLTSLGDVELRLGKTADAGKHFHEALGLFGDSSNGESIDWRHGRALVKLRVAETATTVAGQPDPKSLLRDACEDLALMAKTGEFGATVVKFGRDLQPEALLANSLLSTPTFGTAERQWMDIAVDRLEQPGGTGSTKFMRALLRGLLWFRVGSQAFAEHPANDEARTALEKAVAAFVQADANEVEEHHRSDAFTNWTLAQCRATQARLLIERNQPAEAIKLMRQACDSQKLLLATLDIQGNQRVAAWRSIDPSATAFANGQAADGAAYRVEYFVNLAILVQMLREHGDDAKPVVAEAEKMLGDLKPSADWPIEARLRFAQSLMQLAVYHAGLNETSKAVEQFAAQARLILEAIRVSAADNLDIDLPLFQAYLLEANAAEAQQSGDAISLMDKAESLHDSLGRSTSPLAARRSFATFGSFFATELARTKPEPWEKIWHVAQDSLTALQIFSDAELNTADRENLRTLTTQFVSAAMAWTMKVQDHRPVSKAEVAKICDPAIAALRGLKDRLGSLSDQETKTLGILQTFRDADYDKP